MLYIQTSWWPLERVNVLTATKIPHNGFTTAVEISASVLVVGWTVIEENLMDICEGGLGIQTVNAKTATQINHIPHEKRRIETR